MKLSEPSPQIWKWAGIGLILALFSLWILPSQDEKKSHPNILLITIDALRADHLGCYGYPQPVSPAIDQLAREGILFANVTVPRSLTWPSLCSMWTSLYPLTHGVADGSQTLHPDVATLPRIFKENGYRTAAFVSNYFPESYGFTTFKSFVHSGGIQGKWDERATQAALEWLKEQSESENPYFCWVHYFGPHSPYDPGSKYAEQFAPDIHYKYSGTFEELRQITTLREELEDRDFQHLVNRYDAQIAETDDQVQKLVDWLKEQGDPENTILILSSDHGQELYDHHYYFEHYGSIYEGALRIPLILVQPDRLESGRVREELIENLDLFPTLLDISNLWTPKTKELLRGCPVSIQGRSFEPLLKQKAGAIHPDWKDRFTYSYLPTPEGNIFALRNQNWKYISNPEQYEVQPYKEATYSIEPEVLYSLSKDPRETLNVAQDNQKRIEQMEERLIQWNTMQSLQLSGKSVDDAKEQMHRLGYFQ